MSSNPLAHADPERGDLASDSEESDFEVNSDESKRSRPLYVTIIGAVVLLAAASGVYACYKCMCGSKQMKSTGASGTDVSANPEEEMGYVESAVDKISDAAGEVAYQAAAADIAYNDGKATKLAAKEGCKLQLGKLCRCPTSLCPTSLFGHSEPSGASSASAEEAASIAEAPVAA